MTYATPDQIRLTDARVALFAQRDRAEKAGDVTTVTRIDQKLATLARDILALNRD